MITVRHGRGSRRPCGVAHGWAPDDWDALAGGVVAGHVVECTPRRRGQILVLREVQAWPGSVSVGRGRADGSGDRQADGTGGQVSIGTVTSQLLTRSADRRTSAPTGLPGSTRRARSDRGRPGSHPGCKGSPRRRHSRCDERAGRISQRHGDRADRLESSGGEGRRRRVLGRLPVHPGRVRFDRDACRAH